MRTNYWELLTDALIEGFYKPVQEWCEKYGKLLTAHLKAEENPFFQLSYSGSAFQVLPHVTLPAIDALERNPGNHFYPRMAHSISVQQGRESTLVEAMGGAGWGASPESFKAYALWLASHGIEIFVMHLAQFKLSMQALQDWPPSIPLHLTWKNAFSTILEDIKEEAAKLPDLRNTQPELLVVVPTRGIMSSFLPHEAMVINEHDGSFVPDTASGMISNRFMELVQELYESGIHYEFTEEKVLEETAVVDSGKLYIGQRAYNKVLISEGCLWHPKVKEFHVIDTLVEADIEILSPDNWKTVLVGTALALESLIHKEKNTLNQSLIVAQSPWTITAPMKNQMLIEMYPDGDNQLTATFRVASSARTISFNLHFFDRMTSVSLNGHWLNGIRVKDGYSYDIPENCLAADSEQFLIVKTFGQTEPNPVAFLQGQFLVNSLAKYTGTDKRQWSTIGPFIAEAAGSVEIQGNNLVEAGFPFCEVPATAKKMITINENLENVRLHLTEINADAVQVFLDGEQLGWSWGPDWSFVLPQGLAGGEHELSVHIVPSTFNAYGPHRYFEGDRHLTSPFQYAGIKSFADSPNAPEMTLDNLWHFVKWGVKGDVVQA